MLKAALGDQLIAPGGGRGELEAEGLAGVGELNRRRRQCSQHGVGAEDDERGPHIRHRVRAAGHFLEVTK